MNDDERICERCNEYVEEVGPVPFKDGTGYWDLCEDCARDVEKYGEESPCD